MNHEYDMSDHSARAGAWTRLLVQVPEIRELIEYASSLRASLPQDDKRRLVLSLANDLGLSVRAAAEAALPAGIPASILDEDAETVIHALITAAFAKSGPKTLWEVASLVERAFDWNELLADFALAQAAGDNEDLMGFLMDGLIFDGVLFSKSDTPMPYVVAGSTPKTTRAAHLSAYRHRMRSTFEGIPNPNADTVAFLAECVEIRDSRVESGGERLSPSKIARELVYRQFPEANGVDQELFMEDYGDVYRSFHDRVRQAFSRDAKAVTETRRTTSQDSD